MKNTQTGATRVILGSNNLDQLPANSDRNQALVYFDDENAFNYYMNIYNDFKQNNSEIVNENAWEITYEDTQMLENLPILHKAKQDSEHIYPAVSKTTIVKQQNISQISSV